MPRPMKCRKIDFQPGANFFKPAGIPVSGLEIVVLTLDEMEALRLADLEGLYQEDAAKTMNVSRQTFGNIVESARRKTADALINGKALKIEGGTVIMMERKIICQDCGNSWKVPCGTGHPVKCPSCGSVNIQRHHHDRGCRKRRRDGHDTNAKRSI